MKTHKNMNKNCYQYIFKNLSFIEIKLYWRLPIPAARSFIGNPAGFLGPIRSWLAHSHVERPETHTQPSPFSIQILSTADFRSVIHSHSLPVCLCCCVNVGCERLSDAYWLRFIREWEFHRFKKLFSTVLLG